MKDLGEDVIRQLNSRLAGDPGTTSLIYKSFGIRVSFQGSLNIFELFPDTPVKLLKDVFEALQLYDLVDLLEKPQKPQEPQPVRSLRPALPLQEIKKLRKTTDPRPTTYHSNVAVLIVTDKNDPYTEGIGFFKSLSSKNDVTVFEWQTLANVVLHFETSEPSRLETMDKTKLRRLEEEAQKEMVNNVSAVSAVIERWIHDQGW